MRRGGLAGALLAAAALLAGQAAEAGVEGCRQVPVVPIRCVSGLWQGARCAPIPYARQPCFAVHGRLAAYNGTPSFRLLPQGSRRILGVVDGRGAADSDTVLPPAAEALAQRPTPGAYRDLAGDFRVCPLAPDEPGWMRLVCIEAPPASGSGGPVTVRPSRSPASGPRPP